MSGWNEDNFLDELTPLLRNQQNSARRCPDDETLCAVLDGEASDVLRNAVTAHVAKCPACASLQQRLMAFRQAGAPDTDWHRTEQRLNNSMEGWLARQPLAGAQRAAAEPWWRPRRGMIWALAGALAVVLAAGLLVINQGRTARPAGIAAIPPVPEPPPMQAANETRPAEEFEKSPTGKAAEAVQSGDVQLSPALAGTVSAPASVRLAEGTRLWIFLKSLEGRPDQTFEFRGVVLLPVVHGRDVLLDQATEVYGTGKVQAGRTSVRIEKFGLHGKQYELTSPAAVTGEHAGGPGGSLQFDTGQVLEMWLASASTYQKVSGETGQP